MLIASANVHIDNIWSGLTSSARRTRPSFLQNSTIFF
jgi:hypothetical protein